MQSPTIYDSAGREITEERRSAQYTIEEIFAHEAGSLSRSIRATRPFIQNIWIYSAVTDIAATIANIPLGLWLPGKTNRSRFSKQTWVEIHGHPLIDLLDNPNPWMNGFEFIEQICVNLLMTGNAWVYIDDKVSTGYPRALLVFPSCSVSAMRNRMGEPPRAWLLKRSDGTTLEIPLNRMIHYKVPNDVDAYVGIAPWQAMRASTDADYARQLYDRFFFENNATPDAVLTYKNGTLTEPARKAIYNAWYDAHGGTSNVGKIAVLSGDFELKRLGIDHASSQFILSRKFTRQEAAAAYHYPVQLLNDLETGGFSQETLSAARMMKYEQAVSPHAERLTRGLSLLLSDADKKRGLSFFFDFDNLPIMADVLLQKSKVIDNLTNSYIPINSLMSRLDMGISPVEGGDVGYIDSNKVPLGSTQPAQETQAKPRNQKVLLKRTEDIRCQEERIYKRAKRIMFSMRNDALRSRGLSIDQYVDLWIKRMSAPIYNIIILSYSSMRECDYTVISCIDEMKTVVVDDKRLSGEIVAQTTRSLELVKDTLNHVSLLHSDKNIRSFFHAIDEVCKQYAKQQSVWCKNSGIYAACSGDVSYEHTCTHGDIDDRYPGDPLVALSDINGCACTMNGE